MEKKVDEFPQVEKANIIKEEVEELFQETGDSRPRKPLRKPSSGNPGTCNGCGATLQEKKSPLPPAARDSLETKNAEPKKKLWFSLSLSPEEIEEDILLMTGSKPSRKPKKRAEAVQKELDKLFPGMGLASGTPDACQVPVCASTIFSRGTSPSSPALSKDVGVERTSESSGK